jgi:ribonuclease VapC
MTAVVLDASALLALLLAEPGAEIVAAHIHDSFISSVNFAEVVGHYAKHEASESQIRELLRPLPLVIIPFDEAAAFRAGLLRPLGESVGLSLGDRACLSLARFEGRPAVTADRAWRAIGQAYGVTVAMIR